MENLLLFVMTTRPEWIYCRFMDERGMTLARDWDFRDVRLWHWSEKFDGCRAYWDGACFWTRGGNVINAPAEFVRSMPAGVHLDGEIWAGRGNYTVAQVATQHGIWDERIVFVAFDAPNADGDWLTRMRTADRYANKFLHTPARGVIRGWDEASDRAAEIIAQGGEGLMLRSPNVFEYQRRRTVNLLRIKSGNLYAPWHGAKQQIFFKPCEGFDMSRWPFDPKMEHDILHQ